MSEISASKVKELRERTGAGMMECKKALTEASGDLDLAIENLRKSGVLKAAKKASRVASEGLVQIALLDALASVLEINCETDFVTKNQDFVDLLSETNQIILKNQPASVEALIALKSIKDTSKTLGERVTDLVATIGENIAIRRFHLIKAEAGEKLGSYTHMGSKIGVVVRIKGNIEDAVLKDVAMHVAAAAPRYLSPKHIPEAVLVSERAIYRETMKNEKKPPEIIEKILDGKVKKFAEDVCLTEQIYVKDPSGKQHVLEFLKRIDKNAEIVEFVRLQVGEGIEKKKEDFAEEVAKLTAS